MKYMGSKARLSKDLAPVINNIIKENNIKIYIEPFVGGANMIQHIQSENKIGYDNNRYLISMWNDIKNGWMPPKEMSKELYLDIKDNKTEYEESLVSIAGFCATYNAKWFGGYAGKVKTKNGTIRDYYDESVRNILKQKELLLDVKFINDTFENIEIKNAVIYCDPPYENTTQYGTSKGFNHQLFWSKVRDWSLNNIVLVSEYNAPDDFAPIFEKIVTTTLDKSSRKKNTEKLFIHKSLINKLK